MDKFDRNKNVKKISGGEPIFKLNNNLNRYREFVNREFENNGIIKKNILSEINAYIRLKKNSNDYDYNLFYIYDDDKNIISIGMIDKKPYINNNTSSKINGKDYLYIKYLLSRIRGNRGGTSAIYHLLSRLPKKYSGIFLHSIPNAKSFYKHIGFTEYSYSLGELLILDKTQENIDKLKVKLSPITTHFYSTYPDNQIT